MAINQKNVEQGCERISSNQQDLMQSDKIMHLQGIEVGW
jgi:hypothetical protein